METDASPAFAAIYDQYKEKVYRLCLGYTGDGDLAHDLTQESFIKIWQHLSEFRNEAALGTWIYRIAANTCLGHLRVVKKGVTDPFSRQHEEIPEETVDQEKQIEALHRSINELEEQDRIIITLVLESAPYRQIAEVTGISEGNVRVRVHRILEENIQRVESMIQQMNIEL